MTKMPKTTTTTDLSISACSSYIRVDINEEDDVVLCDGDDY